MSINLANINLVGNLVEDPQIRYENEERTRQLVAFRMAVNHGRYDTDGKWTPRDTLFIEVQCWNRLAANARDTLRKGDAVIVCGELTESTWTQTNAETGELENRRRLRVRATNIGPDLNFRSAQLKASVWNRGGDARADANPAVATNEAVNRATAEAGDSGENGLTVVSGEDQGKELVGAGVGTGGDAGDGTRETAGSGDLPPF